MYIKAFQHDNQYQRKLSANQYVRVTNIYIWQR